jgi:hypothetical protein
MLLPAGHDAWPVGDFGRASFETSLSDHQVTS